MNHLLLYRYLVFALLVICNAISCSVAVWNLSLVQSFGQMMQVDAFLAFLGAFGLFFTFIIVFIEILRKNAITGRLWFEVMWVGIFWIMELSGAAALTAIAPDVLCGRQAALVGNDACTSAHVLLAFSWISTITLLVYLITLVCAAIVRQKHDPEIWHAGVREFCRSHSRNSLTSAPNSPSLPRFHKPTPDVMAPQPRRAPPPMVFAHRSGLGPEYQIEHYQPTSPAAERPFPPIPAAAPPHHLRENTRTATSQSSLPAPSLYPLQLNSSLTPHQLSRASPATPPPLGDWPRADAVAQPAQSKRKQPPAEFTFPARGSAIPEPTSATNSSPSSSSPPRSRPTGPRKRSSSNEILRPPPLDLTRISAFRSSGGESGL